MPRFSQPFQGIYIPTIYAQLASLSCFKGNCERHALPEEVERKTLVFQVIQVVTGHFFAMLFVTPNKHS